MDCIDFKAITAEAALEISNMPLKQGDGFLNGYVTCIDATPDTISQMLLEKVWAKCVGVVNSLDFELEPLAVEKALSILLRKSTVHEKIVCKKNSFRVQLANGQYRAYRKNGTGNIWACPWPAVKRYEIQIGGEQFANFLLQFDEVIPEILNHIPAIMDNIRTREWEERKEMIEKELKEKVIQSVIDGSLKPLGLSVQYMLGEGDMVFLDISQVLSARLELPLCQLPEKLNDAEAVMAMLQIENPEEKVIDDGQLVHMHYPC